ncbi:hypothetical protein [Niastella sp. OAS944]|uniref:hypothetical protein n=1 Tax=Niastella sp. OAS944 TaxID=2664089 RepID=UPI0035C7B7BA|nr:hypothetical protein [Chitinophagaceae bacterium OAS944]
MKYFVYLCLLLLSLESAAQPAVKAISVPASMCGHWLKTDGSNGFVIGIYPNAVCYENETWRIKAAKQIQQRWQLQLENDNSKKIIVTIQRKDSTTLLLGNIAQQELKNICTFNSNYRPKEATFHSPLFTGGNALLKGQLHWKENDNENKTNFVQLSYTDVFTGEEEYLYADLDNQGRFSLPIPLRMPVICSLINGRQQLGAFLVQPGDTLLLAYNFVTDLNENKQDYSKLMQSVCLMGSEAAFNNQYQYFKRYVTNDEEKKSDAVTEQYDNVLRGIDRVYPAHVAEQRFIDFVKADARYNYVLKLLKSSRMGLDSTALQKIYEQYLSQETPLAFIHDNFYKLAGSFDDYLRRSRSFPLVFDANTDIAGRLKKDYKLLLPPNFIEKNDEIRQYWKSNPNQRLNEPVITENFFNGNKKEAERFMDLHSKIVREFEKEVYDSVAYGLYERLIPNASMRFALNLQQLHGNSLLQEDIAMPSKYRITIFENHSQLSGLPYHQVAQIKTARIMKFQIAAFEPMQDSGNLLQIDRELELQKALKAYRGKTVVMVPFSHYFEKENVAQKIYRLKKIQERYRAKNVVFVKCIQPRNRSDWEAILFKYIEYFSGQQELNNVLYCEGLASWRALERETREGIIIYNSSGQLHHPQYTYVTHEQRRKENFVLMRELDSVIAGKGRYYEQYADLLMRGDGKKEQTWTLYDSTGNYFFYVLNEVNEPIPNRSDSVFHLLSVKDSLYRESDLVLHRLPQTDGSRSSNNKPAYTKSYQHAGPACTYRYDRSTRLLRIYDDNKKLLRTFRVLLITDIYLELELIPLQGR